MVFYFIFYNSRHKPQKNIKAKLKRQVKLVEDTFAFCLVFSGISLLSFCLRTCLKADDNGEGDTFALHALLCRHAQANSLPQLLCGWWGALQVQEGCGSYYFLTSTATFGSRLKSIVAVDF